MVIYGSQTVLEHHKWHHPHLRPCAQSPIHGCVNLYALTTFTVSSLQRGERMTHDEVQAIIDEADKNGDGKLDYAEFCHMLLTTSEQCVQASTLKAKRLVPSRQYRSQHGLEQVKFQRYKEKEGKARSLAHQGSGHDRRERRREEIRYQLYPVEGQSQESHLLSGSHPHYSKTRTSVSGPVYSSGDHIQGYPNGFLQETTIVTPACFPESFDPSLPVHNQAQSLVAQPPESILVSGTAKAAYGEVKATPMPSLQEGNGDSQAKTVEGNDVAKDELSKLHPPSSSKPHPSPSDAQAQTSVSTEASLIPSRSDVNGGAESLSSVVPSSVEISDPFALPSSTSLPKLPPLKKSSLPPLLPPIGGTVAKQVVELAERLSEAKGEVSKDSQPSEEKGGKRVKKESESATEKEDSTCEFSCCSVQVNVHVQNEYVHIIPPNKVANSRNEPDLDYVKQSMKVYLFQRWWWIPFNQVSDMLLPRVHGFFE